jgi:peroxiredoxin
MMPARKVITIKWRILAAVVAIATISLAVFSFAGAPDSPKASVAGFTDATGGLNVAPSRGALAPDFTLINLAGEEVSLSDFRGQPIVINFWASWCGPCRLEMPAIQERYKKYKDEGLVILAVNFDEPVSVVKSFRDELDLTFTLLLDPGAIVQRLYRNRTYPTSFFVDVDGIIQWQHIGVMTERQIDENLVQIGLGP